MTFIYFPVDYFNLILRSVASRVCYVLIKDRKRLAAIFPLLFQIDQAHEQNNALVKGEGGAVGDRKSKRSSRWMVSGPEIA